MLKDVFGKKNTCSITVTGVESNWSSQILYSIQIPTNFHKSITFTDKVIILPK